MIKLSSMSKSGDNQSITSQAERSINNPFSQLFLHLISKRYAIY